MRENEFVPCMVDPSKKCDCPLLATNAQYLNALGKGRKSIGGAIQREGYDRISPGLIKQLLVNPEGGYYTEGLDQVLPFSPRMQKIREKLLKNWEYEVLAKSPQIENVPCPRLRDKLTKNSPPP